MDSTAEKPSVTDQIHQKDNGVKKIGKDEQHVSVQPSSSSRKTKKTSTKKAIDPEMLTPEYIEEQRRLRELRKQQKRTLNEALGKKLPLPKKDIFIKRPMLALPGTDSLDEPEFRVKIMSYNILAQSLIRRTLFPTNGAALKWPNRSKALLEEFKHYNADILCLQEVDVIQFKLFWSKEFDKLGYNHKFYSCGTKNHGVAIVFRKDMFIFRYQTVINYDKEDTDPSDNIELPPPRTITQNIGLLAFLEFTPAVLKKYPKVRERNGLIIGTTHMFWHPFGTFERTRQAFLVLYKYKQFMKTLSTTIGNSKNFYTFFSGDMNSQPYDCPYLSITAKPVSYDSRAKNVITCALSYQYSKRRNSLEVKDGGNDEENLAKKLVEDDDSKEEEEDSEHSEENDDNDEEDAMDKPNPTETEPEFYEGTSEEQKLVKSIQDAHNALDMRAISLYAVGYKQVHPNNSGLDNNRNEPMFSNWANSWRGLLDYIFVISRWDAGKEDLASRVDSPLEVEQNQGIRLVKLLRMPEPKEMGPEPSGQPRLNQYPSDHLCLIAEVELV